MRWNQIATLFSIEFRMPVFLLALWGLSSSAALATDKSEIIRPVSKLAAKEKEIVPLGSVDGWVCASSDNSADNNQLEVLPSGRGVLQWTLRRKPSVFNALVRPVAMCNFQALDFDICSKVATPIVVPLTDQDGAKFHYLLNADGGRWRHVHLTPADFKLSEDSPVKKSFLDPSKLSANFSIADLGGVFGSTDANVIQLSGLYLQRDGIPNLELPSHISGRVVEILDDCHIRNEVTVKDGAVLRIRAKRLKLSANIKLETGGILDIAGSTITFANRFPHDITFSAHRNALISIIRCQSMSTVPTGLDLFEGSRLRIADTTFVGAGLTVGAPKGCIVELSGVKTPGELVFQPGSRVALSNCDGVLLWPWYHPPFKVNMVLPSGSAIANWSMPTTSGHDLSIKNSRTILWGAVVDKGADVTFKDSQLRAVGLPLQGVNLKVAGLRNKAPLSGGKMPLSDRNLALNNCRVEAWNLYPGKDDRVTVDKCLLGEVIAFDSSQCEIANSTCDATGGYVAAKDRSKLTLTNCTLNSLVTSVGHATLVLRKCTVNGPLNAAGKSTIHLIDTTVNGPQKQLDGGIILKLAK